MPVEFEFPAQTAGSREVEVRARVTGILLKRNYEEGARVREGQSLFTIDPAPFEAALARAQAEAASAQAAHAQAARNAARYKPLFEAKAASQKDYDDAVSAEEIAAASLKAARARLDEARLNLSWTRVEWPIAGITSRALKSEGSLVSGPDVLLTTVTQSDPLYVNFGLSEAELARLQRDRASGALVLPRDGRFEVAVRLEGNGGEALEKVLSARDAGDPVRLVVTDIRMPVMSGIELIEALREHGVDAALCAITCFGDQALVSELAGKGCTDYVEKPFSPDDLVRRIRAILGGDPG